MQSRTTVRTACAVLFIAAALAPEPIRAAEPSSMSTESVPPTSTNVEPSPHGRILNGHAFMPALDVPGALVTTSFVSGLLIAAGETSGTFTTPKGQTLSGNFDYAGIGAVVGYEYAFLNYFSVRIALTELLFSGTSGKSAVVIGTGLQGGAGLGATASLPVGDTLRLGILFDVSATPKFGLTIGNGLKGLIETCQGSAGQACDIHAGDFFQNNNVISIQPALAANWAPIPALGVTANGSYIDARQHLSGETFYGQALQLGAALDWDFGAISSVPIGLQVQFSWIAPISGSGLQHVSDIGGGIFYTGRKNLALGVQVIDRRFAVTPDVDVSWKTFLVDIGMRYYW